MYELFEFFQEIGPKEESIPLSVSQRGQLSKNTKKHGIGLYGIHFFLLLPSVEQVRFVILRVKDMIACIL